MTINIVFDCYCKLYFCFLLCGLISSGANWVVTSSEYSITILQFSTALCNYMVNEPECPGKIEGRLKSPFD